MATFPDLDRLFADWRQAAVNGQATLAAELRAMYLALTPGRAVPQPPLTAYPDCLGCTGTLAEIARLSDQLRAHQAGVQHSGTPERL